MTGTQSPFRITHLHFRNLSTSFPYLGGRELRTIAIANQKGGCGKTTIAVSLSASLAFLGKKILLIDLDPQGHASLALGVRAENLGRSLYDVLDETVEQRLSIRDVRVILSNFLHLVPSEIVLSAIEQKLSGVPDRENKLFSKLEGLEQEYDFILIDCPPNLGLLTFNALRAASELIIPVECSTFSLHGLAKIVETVRLVEEALGHKLAVHALMNDYDPRTRFAKRIQEELNRLFEGRLFKTVIHHSVRLREAAACGRSIVDYDRQSQVFRDYLNLSAEVMEQANSPQPQVSFATFDESRLDVFRSEFLPSPRHRSAGDELQSVLFTIRAPGARFVQIAGDFNGWVPEELHPPIKEGGIWRKIYRLKPREYKYKFIVDGEWATDPRNQRAEPNPFGGLDSVLEVKPLAVLHGWG